MAGRHDQGCDQGYGPGYDRYGYGLGYGHCGYDPDYDHCGYGQDYDRCGYGQDYDPDPDLGYGVYRKTKIG